MGKAALVGYTGFVGSNLYEKGTFADTYNSKNIETAYGTNPELLIYAGLRAEKYLANREPDKDRALVSEAMENIRKIHPKRLVLISTIDVFKNPKNMDESAQIDTDGLLPYGYNRYLLETWVREYCPDALIVRLPGLFGKNLKKNFIYDFINVIPFMLKADKFQELSAKDPQLSRFYELQENGFYKVHVSENDRSSLKERFQKLGFSAVNFTDSRSKYQFYNLSRLWADIQVALEAGLTVWHPATEPVSAGELYHFLTGEQFQNELGAAPVDYDYRTRYDTLFGGANGYICEKETVLKEIEQFVRSEKRRN